MSTEEEQWISRRLEELVGEQRDETPIAFDVVIVGSGYGGSMAACALAGATTPDGEKVSVCVLERGQEYLPGMFPASMARLPGHIRYQTTTSERPFGVLDGLFDVRAGSDVTTVVANGLGGGSLINAGVIAEPSKEVLRAKEWPAQLEIARDGFFDEAKRILCPAAGNTIDRHPAAATAKTLRMDELAGGEARRAEISVSMTNGPNAANVRLNQCIQCGDCVTGCNYGAKDSLDANALTIAAQRGASIVTCATVHRIHPPVAGAGPWMLDVVYTDEHLRRHQKPVRFSAGLLILAAGTLGSTEILLRSSSAGPKHQARAADGFPVSEWVGQGFSTNGDALLAVYGMRTKLGAPLDANAFAKPWIPPNDRQVGPTISSIIDLRGSSQQPSEQLVFEEMATPAALRRISEEVLSTTHLLHSLGERPPGPQPATGKHFDDPAIADPCAVAAEEIDGSLLIAAMGDDGAMGKIALTQSEDPEIPGGVARIVWKELREHQVFKFQLAELTRLVRASGRTGQVLPNPLWKPLPDGLESLLGNAIGPAVTVHPLGGCRMGISAETGAVNHVGQVFRDQTGAAVYKDLVVLDGSIIPRALGINPALTIAAVALRAARALLLERGWQPPMETFERGSDVPVRAPERNRAIYTPPPELPELVPSPTRVAMLERWYGEFGIAGAQPAKRYMVELTLPFRPESLHAVAGRDGARTRPISRRLQIDDSDRPERDAREQPRLRIFEHDDWERLRHRAARDSEYDDNALLIAKVTGEAHLLHFEPSSRWRRVLRAAWAWLLNRGTRDVWSFLTGRRRITGAGGGVFGLVRRYINLFDDAGQVRRFDYRIKIGEAVGGTQREVFAGLSGRAIAASKRLTYSVKSNPWRQLMELSVSPDSDALTASVASGNALGRLTLDTEYLARQAVPLLRITSQSDQVSALMDLASVVAFLARLIIRVHLFSFRLPDESSTRAPNRLPLESALPDNRLPKPEILRETPILDAGRKQLVPEIGYQLDSTKTLSAALAEVPPDKLRIFFATPTPEGMRRAYRLTRYASPKSAQPPLLMIHGYSASGNTYTHPAIPTNMAEYFFRRGRDVWVLDLRTSSGLDTAYCRWHFEDAALNDIPAAVAEICKLSGATKIDIFAHCMGAAMLGMAILATEQQKKLPTQIRRSMGAAMLGMAILAEQRKELPTKIRRIVTSQVSPVVVFTSANVARSVATRFLQWLLGQTDFQFRPDLKDVGSNANTLLDRILSTLPYPEEEFTIENPRWPRARRSWVRTRHRMDALYGRDFEVNNVSLSTLEYIDDLFGPLNLDTVSQAAHFARREVITDHVGQNVYVSRERLHSRWSEIPTLHCHGKWNGLSDIATLERMKAVFRDAGVPIQTEDFADAADRGIRFGHQDSLIGPHAPLVFEKVAKFFDEAFPTATLSSEAS